MNRDEDLLRRGLRLEYATLGWNVIGVVVMAVAAISARSVALAGFGLDSLIEIGASTVVVWQLRGVRNAQRELRAMRLIGAGFLALSGYIAIQSAYVLVAGFRATVSPLGIGWTAVTFVAMLALAAGKASTGKALGNRVLETEAKVTVVDAYLAGSVLVGLVLNATLSWWWADPLSALVIVVYGMKEARAAFRAK